MSAFLLHAGFCCQKININYEIIKLLGVEDKSSEIANVMSFEGTTVIRDTVSFFQK